MKRGGAIESNKEVNCGTCAIRTKCRDNRKSSKFACTFHVMVDSKNPSDVKFAQYLNELATSESIVADKWQIDDGDAPRAPNFYRWCTGHKYLKMDPSPYPKQLQLGLKFFQDMCPWCSDKEWFDEIPHDADIGEIPERLKLYKHGTCPRCSRTRLDAIKAGYTVDYEDLVVVAGQRSGKCLVGSTLVKTGAGLRRIRDVRPGEFACVAGKSYPITKFWKRPKRPVVRVTTALGYDVTGTPDHKVLTINGWCELAKAKTLRVEMAVGPFPTRAAYRKRVVSGEIAELARVADAKPHHLLSYLIALPEDDLAEAVRERVVNEHFSNGVLGIEFASLEAAKAVHTIILQWGIVAHLTGKVLRIPQPWARRYARHVGIGHRHIAACVALSNRQLNPYVHDALAELLDETCKMVDPEEHQPPQYKSDWAECKQKMHARTFRRSDASLACQVLSKLKVKDRFYTHLIQSMLKSSITDDAIWDTVASCTRATTQEVFDVEVQDLHAFVANGLVVHNSTSIGLLASYQTHLLLKLKNPAAFYGIKQGTILYSSIVGLTYSGAKTNVWDPLLATIQDAPWYDVYHEILNTAAAQRGEEELARVKDTFIYYRNAGLYMAPASPSRRTLRGKTRIMATVDELAHFSSNDKLVNISGIEVWNALSRSMQTVRLGAFKLRKRGVVNVPPAMQIAISSPYEVTDPIMTLYNKPTSRTYAVLYPTWEFNSEMTFEFLKPEFDRDATTAWRDFGCRPPYSAASFVANIDPFRRIINKGAKPCCTAKTYVVKRTGKRVLTAAELSWNWTDTSVPKLLAIDAGSHFNAFSLALAHLNIQGHVVYDTFLEVHPTPGRPISFTRIYEDVMVPIMEKMNVKVLTSDRWQNKKILDDSEENQGVVPIEHRLKYGDMLAWREALIEGEFEMPRPEMAPQQILYPENALASFINNPVASFVYQSLRVVDVPGKKVEKPSEGSDDVFRSAVLAYTVLQNDEVRTLLTSGDVLKRTPGGIGAYATSATHRHATVAYNIGARSTPGRVASSMGSVGIVRRR